MKKIVLWVALILSMMGSLSAREVPKTVAEKVAKNFYYQRVNQVKEVDYKSIELGSVALESKNSQAAYYVFNVNEAEGYVLVSAQSSVTPVLAYAFKGEFNGDNMSPAQEDMLDWYAKQIAYAAEKKLTATEEIENEWRDLVNYIPQRGIREIRGVEPLLKVKWNQGWPYNAMCPEDAGSAANGHTYVGCVATAMVQVLKHWNYPETGTSSKTSYNFNNGGYGNITVNYASKNYNWQGMPLKASGENDEMAEICFHAGVAVNMEWGPDGSGTFTERVPDALVNYFKIDHDCHLVSKGSYSEAQYKNILKEQLDAKHPMVYSGSSSSTGHAWNCDGYQDDEFHMNWGWGGAGDGYYTLDNLISTATSGGSENNFIYGQDAVINIYPESSFPEHCSGNKTVVSHQGAFGDGSAELNYNNNLSCEYLISPECGNYIRLKFEEFDLGTGDVVTLYDGTSTSGNLLGTFDADNLPGDAMINAHSGNLFILFQTDGNSSGDGWYVTFDSEYCSSTSHYTNQSGEINDGSGSCDYLRSTVCFWYVEPDGAEAVKLDFTEFDLADGDYITIYENSTLNTLGSFDADNAPESIVVNAPKAIVLFYTNADDQVAGGWTLNYSTTEADVNSYDALSGVSVYPNPANDELNVAFSLSQPSDVDVKVYDMLGKTIFETKFSGQVGYQQIRLSDMIDFPEAGLFFIDLKAMNKTITKKVSIVK